MELQRTVTISPAFDKRKTGHGIHGCDIRFVLKGPHGAVQFLLFTNWYLKIVDGGLGPMPADLGYHSPTPRYEGQPSMKCDLLECGTCYYDGSGLNAEEPWEILRKEGSDGLWKFLEGYYNRLFTKQVD